MIIIMIPLFFKIYLNDIENNFLSKKKNFKIFFSNFVEIILIGKFFFKKNFFRIHTKDENRTKENNKFDILQKILNKNLKIWLTIKNQ